MDESMGSSVAMGSPANSCGTSVLYVLRGCTDAGLAMQPQHTPTMLLGLLLLLLVAPACCTLHVMAANMKKAEKSRAWQRVEMVMFSWLAV
jgi:hypothetical protein